MDKFKNVISESDVSLLLSEFSDLDLVNQLDSLSVLRDQRSYSQTVLSVFGDILYQLMLVEISNRFSCIVLDANGSVGQT